MIALHDCHTGIGEFGAGIEGTARIGVRDRAQRERGALGGADVARSEGDLGLRVEERGEAEITERGALLRGDVDRMGDGVGDEGRCAGGVTLGETQECQAGLG